MSDFGNYNNINSSIRTRDAVTSLNKVNKDLGSQNEKLSTGKSVNKAEDDAVSINISKHLESHVAGMEKALEYADSDSQEDFLASSIVAYSSSASNTIDTDMAKAQSESIRMQIMQETTTSALAQANINPASVLDFLK